MILLDARPSAFYEGQGPWILPGHIPGAVSLPWKSLMDGTGTGSPEPEDQILALIKAAGVTPDKTIICSCGTGREATNEFVLFPVVPPVTSKVRIYRIVHRMGVVQREPGGDRKNPR